MRASNILCCVLWRRPFKPRLPAAFGMELGLVATPPHVVPSIPTFAYNPVTSDSLQAMMTGFVMSHPQSQYANLIQRMPKAAAPRPAPRTLSPASLTDPLLFVTAPPPTPHSRHLNFDPSLPLPPILNPNASVLAASSEFHRPSLHSFRSFVVAV